MKFSVVGTLVLAALLAGCSSLRPWQNIAAPQGHTPVSGTAAGRPTVENHSIVAALTLSGGGARAAAFGLGVLRELKATRFVWEGRETTLLDELGLISGVSGGSILAAHYAMFGDETLTRFEPDFLLENFDGDLIRRVLSPAYFHELT
ncbi:MAG TPA: patatin-like phospholipase family protein, partial [Burkholderiaceae bacterium]|nr:patatin-like phospholipase family protein [Burkholderiaceae bacterium]